ncbi:MAG: NAD-dependent DNA ligase LigA [Prevotellaceae bacterium]|jgi:DNA ligase (NAD+)|nr:NAD-dependent DNA ligase LigA [Prevotellaceae bacterium]
MTELDARQRVDSLRTEIERLNYEYYVLNSPSTDDFVYDKLMRELNELEQSFPELQSPHSPTMRVGSDILSEFVQVKHRYPMLSLENTYSKEEIDEFDRFVRKESGQQCSYVCELKFDGTAISLTYRHGALTQALTRGDGEQGDDVTANVRTIRSIPLILKGNDYPDEFEIRGEIFMPLTSFERLNVERTAKGLTPFANPRNAAAGTLKMLDSTEVAKRGLDCFLYFILGESLPFDKHFDNMSKAAEWGFKVSPNMQICADSSQIMSFLNRWESERRSLPCDTDGAVIKVNDYAVQRKLGLRAKSPRWAVAYKYKAEQARTVLVSIDYQVGRTGAITPVANLAPVQLGGTTVKRASLHNAEQIELHDIRVGDTVIVEKGGEIIPKVTGVDTELRPADSQALVYPSTCPECGARLIKEPSEAKHYCPNEAGCRPQIQGKIEHFVSRRAMNIDGVGEETAALLFNNGLIRDVADLYSLRKEQIMTLDRMGERSAERIIDGIAQSKQASFARLLYALGIRYVGETTAKKLVEAFHSLDAIIAAQPEELMQADEVGQRIADSIKAHFSDEANLRIINRLREAELQFEAETLPTSKLSDRLAGLSVVISGNFSVSRDEIKQLIEQHGGRNASGVSSKTDYLLAGDKIGPSKLQKAKQLGVKIITEAQLREMIS